MNEQALELLRYLIGRFKISEDINATHITIWKGNMRHCPASKRLDAKTIAASNT